MQIEPIWAHFTQFLTPFLQGVQNTKISIAPAKCVWLPGHFGPLLYYVLVRYLFSSHSAAPFSVSLRDLETFSHTFGSYTWYSDCDCSIHCSHFLGIHSSHSTLSTCLSLSRGYLCTSRFGWGTDSFLDQLRRFTLVSAALAIILLFILKRLSMFLSISSEFLMLYQQFS